MAYRQKLEAIPPDLWKAPPLPEGQKYDPLKAYAAHRRVILKSDPDMEPSRLDSIITLYMRNNGFMREAVRAAIFQCAPEGQPGQPERDWQRYAERATAYAFGLAGDVTLACAAVEREKEKREQQERAENTQRQDAPRLRMR
jgi:hypothetical protein